MTLAGATPTSTKQTVPHAVPIVILGTDAVLAALPATAVQLAHACIEAGFINVIPASWGDELIAAALLFAFDPSRNIFFKGEKTTSVVLVGHAILHVVR